MAFSFIPNIKNKKGFTLIELIIVVAIMGLLTAFIAFISSVMIQRAKVAKAQGDLNTIAKGIRQLELDTGKHPGGEPLTPCLDPVTLFGLTTSDQNNVGLLSWDPSAVPPTFSNWKGPYLEEIPPADPWGSQYYMRYNYPCTSNIKGCEKYTTPTHVRAIFSSGPNRSPVSSVNPAELADDVVLPLCS